MSVVAEFQVPHDEVALATTFSAVPDLVVEVERTVATPTDSVFPYLWALTPDPDSEPPLADDPTVESAQQLAHTDAGRLYAVEWTPIVTERISAVLDLDVTVLQFVGDRCGWHARIRAPEHACLAEFQSLLTDAGVEIALDRVQTPQTPTADVLDTLTSKQREAVAAAVELGFYEVPRDTSMATIAESLDITQQALSKRLRRAHAAIVGETVSENGQAASK